MDRLRRFIDKVRLNYLMRKKLVFPFLKFRIKIKSCLNGIIIKIITIKIFVIRKQKKGAF